MVDLQRCIAGAFVGAGALLLIWRGEITAGTSLLAGMLGFFVGERNGIRKASTATQ